MSIDTVHQVAGNLTRAVDDLTRALDALTSSDEQGLRVRIGAVCNLALCLCDLGRHSEARELIVHQRPLSQSMHDWKAMRLLVYVDQGRTAELRRVSRLIEPILRTRGLHREAIAALVLFQRAATVDAVNRESLLELRRFLEESRRNPRLRFEASGSWRQS